MHVCLSSLTCRALRNSPVRTHRLTSTSNMLSSGSPPCCQNSRSTSSAASALFSRAYPCQGTDQRQRRCKLEVSFLAVQVCSCSGLWRLLRFCNARISATSPSLTPSPILYCSTHNSRHATHPSIDYIDIEQTSINDNHMLKSPQLCIYMTKALAPGKPNNTFECKASICTAPRQHQVIAFFQAQTACLSSTDSLTFWPR